jgi:hypothetical protein
MSKQIAQVGSLDSYKTAVKDNAAVTAVTAFFSYHSFIWLPQLSSGLTAFFGCYIFFSFPSILQLSKLFSAVAALF